MRKIIALAAALSLGGCQTLGALVAPTTPAAAAADLQTLQSDASTVIAGLQGILPSLVALGPQYASTIATIQADLAKASAQLPVLSAFTNVAAATTTAQGIVTALSDALKVAATLPIPQPYAGVIAAANVLLPVILADAGLPVPAAAAVPGGIVITPDQARARLKVAATQGE